MTEIYELFEEFETDVLPIVDFGIITNGVLVTHLHLNENDEVEIWAGNFDEDGYAEQLILPKEERRRIFEEVCENY